MQGSLQSPPIVIRAQRKIGLAGLVIGSLITLLIIALLLLFDAAMLGNPKFGVPVKIALALLLNGLGLGLGADAWLSWREWRNPTELILGPAGLELNRPGSRRLWTWDQVNTVESFKRTTRNATGIAYVAIGAGRDRVVMMGVVWEEPVARIVLMIQEARQAWRGDAPAAGRTSAGRPAPSLQERLRMAGGAAMIAGMALMFVAVTLHPARSQARADTSRRAVAAASDR